MPTQNVSGTVEFVYPRILGMVLTRSSIIEKALQDWRDFTEDPTAELPWNTSVTVGSSNAEVTIRWERTT